ncbi:MAG: tRNA (N6-isopentenyl adenosine(37)-C2)-methylthiotransferase MiaB [Woeseiaceae bacterium]|nr:tRNA (N6-isopentenyl adenosine(37)-C2)-methylthiotransferase MiaB [Woeseiaceae bacterium]
MKNKLFIKTMGCQMNVYDSEKMADILKQSHGYELTEKADEADLLLVNTCSIREKAEEKVFSQLGRWQSMKKENPNLLIGVGGCVASQEGAGIGKRAPFVDLIFGPQTLHRLPAMLEDTKKKNKPVIDISFPQIEKFDCLPEPRAEGPTAFVSIMEGCSKYCTYCVVPYTRGEEISRPLDDVVAEIYILAQQGVKEVNLLGQNVNSYQGKMHDGKISDLVTLIYYVAAVDGIDRIRFTTSHPVEFNDSLIQAYSDNPELANYLHLPVQSGADRILALMKRGHTAIEYKQKIRKLREARPEISISSDFIVGFPGETEDDFFKTMELISDVGFDQSFSFIYSARPGTPASNIKDDTALEVKKERLQTLQAQINKQASIISHSMVGSTQKVLVERRSKKNLAELSGRTENMRWVNFVATDECLGQFVDVVITEALPNSLRGRLV